MGVQLELASPQSSQGAADACYQEFKPSKDKTQLSKIQADISGACSNSSKIQCPKLTERPPWTTCLASLFGIQGLALLLPLEFSIAVSPEVLETPVSLSMVGGLALKTHFFPKEPVSAFLELNIDVENPLQSGIELAISNLNFFHVLTAIVPQAVCSKVLRFIFELVTVQYLHLRANFGETPISIGAPNEMSTIPPGVQFEVVDLNIFGFLKIDLLRFEYQPATPSSQSFSASADAFIQPLSFPNEATELLYIGCKTTSPLPPKLLELLKAANSQDSCSKGNLKTKAACYVEKEISSNLRRLENEDEDETESLSDLSNLNLLELVEYDGALPLHPQHIKVRRLQSAHRRLEQALTNHRRLRELADSGAACPSNHDLVLEAAFSEATPANDYFKFQGTASLLKGLVAVTISVEMREDFIMLLAEASFFSFIFTIFVELKTAPPDFTYFFELQQADNSGIAEAAVAGVEDAIQGTIDLVGSAKLALQKASQALTKSKCHLGRVKRRLSQQGQIAAQEAQVVYPVSEIPYLSQYDSLAQCHVYMPPAFLIRIPNDCMYTHIAGFSEPKKGFV
jgi:hypothetical protein